MWVTNLKILLLVLGTLALYTFIASSIPQVESEVPEELSFAGEVSAEQLVAAGEELYSGSGGCTTCHGTGTRAPNLLTGHAGEGPIGDRCDDRVPGEDCKTYLYRSMVEPGAHVVEGFGNIMPDQSRTQSQNQIWAMVAYLQSLGGEVTVTGADLEEDEGGEPGGGPGAGPGGAAGGAAAGPEAAGLDDPHAILREFQCMNCHTLEGEGVELGPSFEDIGSRLGTDEIRQAILDPGADAPEGFEDMMGVMPEDFGQRLTAAQLEILVGFLSGRN